MNHLMANVKVYKRLPHIFVLALTVSEILKFQILYIQKVGKGHGEQFSYWHYSMGNANIYKRHPHFFVC